MIYRTRSNEELEAIVTTYKENYLNTFGYELKAEEIETMLLKLIEEKKAELCKGVFTNLGPVNLITAIELFKKQTPFKAWSSEISDAMLQDNAKLIKQDLNKSKDEPMSRIPAKRSNKPKVERSGLK